MSEKTKPYEKEIEKIEIPEIQEETKHPGLEEFSLQQDNFAPGENEYLRENPSHSFSEELSDGGERDQIIYQQAGKYCGGL